MNLILGTGNETRKVGVSYLGRKSLSWCGRTGKEFPRVDSGKRSPEDGLERTGGEGHSSERTGGLDSVGETLR